MGLTSLFQKAAQTALKVAGDLPKAVVYKVYSDNGLGTIVDESYTTKVLFDEFSADDRRDLPFYDLIQPKDVKGILASLDLEVEVEAQMQIVHGDDSYTIIAFTTDAASAAYILLLRKT